VAGGFIGGSIGGSIGVTAKYRVKEYFINFSKLFGLL